MHFVMFIVQKISELSSIRKYFYIKCFKKYVTKGTKKNCDFKKVQFFFTIINEYSEKNIYVITNKNVNLNSVGVKDHNIKCFNFKV